MYYMTRLLYSFAAIAGLLAITPGSGWAQAPDVIYHGANVITVDSSFTVTEAVAVTGDTILAVGKSDKILALAGPSTKVVDLRGSTLLPGFYDNHIHLGGPLQPWKWGGMIDRVPDWLRGVNTIPNLKKAIAGKVAETPPGEWIIGDIPREEWPNSALPNRRDLDEVSPDNPVVIARGPHTYLVNSMTLKLAGVTKDTPVPPGGQIPLDENGEPDGRVLESAKRVIRDVMPEGDGSPAHSHGGSDDPDQQELENWHTLLNQLVALGVTSVNVAGVRPNRLDLVETLYEKWGDELPRMTVQLRVSPGYDDYDDVEEGARNAIAEIDAIGDPSTFFKHPKLEMGAVKMSIDGGLSAPVFWSTKEYENRPGFYGVQRIPDKTFRKVAEHAHQRGWQLGIHTMGDAAAVMVVNELAEILESDPAPSHRRRHYLHHVAVLPPEETLEKMARYGINLASQPGFLLSLGSYADEALEPEREATQNPSRSLLQHGVRVSYGSDAGPYGPLAVIFAAVTRTGWNDVVHGPSEAVTIEEALSMHIYEPAYFTFHEDERGSIEPGKVADFVVLDADPLSVDPQDYEDIKIQRTIIGGRDIQIR